MIPVAETNDWNGALAVGIAASTFAGFRVLRITMKTENMIPAPASIGSRLMRFNVCSLFARQSSPVPGPLRSAHRPSLRSGPRSEIYGFHGLRQLQRNPEKC